MITVRVNVPLASIVRASQTAYAPAEEIAQNIDFAILDIREAMLQVARRVLRRHVGITTTYRIRPEQSAITVNVWGSKEESQKDVTKLYRLFGELLPTEADFLEACDR